MGREEQYKQIITGVCGECSQCKDHTGFAPAHCACAFLVYTAQAPCCSAGELSKVGPGFRTLPRSKLLRFRFSGTPRSHRLGWPCVLCPSQVQGAQETRCLQVRLLQLIDSPVPAAWFSGCITGAPSQADVDHPESQEVLVSNKACLPFGR